MTGFLKDLTRAIWIWGIICVAMLVFANYGIYLFGSLMVTPFGFVIALGLSITYGVLYLRV